MFNIENIKSHKRLQLHVVKSHAASNLNRDDLGRPKEMSFGGVSRLRLSSQSLKRAMRMGEVFDSFREHAHGAYGATKMIRTTKIETLLSDALLSRGLAADQAMEGAKAVSATLNKKSQDDEDKKKKKPLAKAKKEQSGDDPEESDEEEKSDDLLAVKSQLMAISQAEIDLLADHLAAVQDKSSKDWAKKSIDTLKALQKSRKVRAMRGDLSPEMQLFGRMVTSDLFSNVDSYLQVAHAFTVHEVVTERDYWTGVDDYKESLGEAGSGMIDVRRFGAGVFYQYACIDIDGLKANIKAAHSELDENAALALTRDLVNAFVLSFIGQNPTGYQNSFASHAMPEFVLAEIGGTFPHSGGAAFEVPVQAKEKDAVGYSECAKARMRTWIASRRRLYGDEMLGELVNLGLDDSGVTLKELVERIGSAV